MIIMRQSDLNDQAGMERALAGYFQDEEMKHGGTLNAMLGARLQECDYEKRTLTLCMETMPWMANPGGTLHGGVMATGFDFAMGLLCRYFSGGRMTPTIDLSINYLRPAVVSDTLIFMAELTRRGSSICAATGKLWAEGREDKLLATASGSFYVLKKN